MTEPSADEGTKSRWPRVRLGDVAELCLGKMLDASKNKGEFFPYLRNPNVRWFRLDLSDLREMRFEAHELERFGLRFGDVLVCEGGEAGRAAIWEYPDSEVKFQKAIHRVRPGLELNNRFLVHRLRADFESGRLSEYYTGATINHLTGQDLARYEFALPPIEEQERLVSILDAAEALREAQARAIALTDRLPQRVFEQRFGDLVNGRTWPRKRVGDFVQEFQSGKNYKPSDVEVEGLQRVLKISAVTGLDFDPRESKPVPAEIAPPQSYFVREGDLLFSRANTAELVGATAFVWREPSKLLLPDKLWRFIWSDRMEIEPLFVWFLFRSSSFRSEISRRATGTSGSMKNITQEKVLSIEVSVPPIDAQLSFADVVRSWYTMRTGRESARVRTDALAASLQQRAFRGEL